MPVSATASRLNTTFMIRSTAPGNQRAVAAAMQQMLAQVYINVAILPIDFQVFLAETHAQISTCGTGLERRFQ